MDVSNSSHRLALAAAIVIIIAVTVPFFMSRRNASKEVEKPQADAIKTIPAAGEPAPATGPKTGAILKTSMGDIEKSLNAFVLDKAHHTLLAILRGWRNGIYCTTPLGGLAWMLCS